jgi:glycine oxidase
MANSSSSTGGALTGLTLTGARWVVAGGGVFGASIAWRLARAGAAVTLCDPAAPGDNASGVAAGMLAPAFESVLDAATGLSFAELAAARDLWPRFAADLGIAVDRAGAMWVGAGADAVAAGLDSIGVASERLTAAQASQRAPGLSSHSGGAVFTTEDWRVEAPAALARILAAAKQAGVRMAPAAVSAFSECGATLSGGEILPADGLVVATGAGGGLLAPEVAALRPIKGQIVRSQAGPSAGPVLRAEGGYVVPGGQGAVIGATMQAGLNDRIVEPAVVQRLLQLGGRLFPAVAQAPHSASAAVRAATPDGAPLVGASQAPGVLLAVGARRNGWLLAPLVAELVARAATGDVTAVGLFDPGRFAPGRFS